jgi:putative membrane protein insertion efficiency factor
LSRLLLWLLAGYSRFLSPLLGPDKCRFHPHCAAYAREAIAMHGAAKGAALAAWRLLRCQPFCRGGYDPVPLKREPAP